MRHRGDTVTKIEILESVWDPAFDGDPNVVEVYIRYLRRKLDAPFGRHAIETVRGMGYRLASDGGDVRQRPRQARTRRWPVAGRRHGARSSPPGSVTRGT